MTNAKKLLVASCWYSILALTSGCDGSISLGDKGVSIQGTGAVSSMGGAFAMDSAPAGGTTFLVGTPNSNSAGGSILSLGGTTAVLADSGASSNLNSGKEGDSSNIDVSTQADKKGLSWYNRGHDDVLRVDFVGCGMTCNPYDGDWSCEESLPILCIKKNGEPNPGVNADNSYYYGWSGGQITTTPPVRGDSLGSIANANAVCAAQFGSGWQMAEHHDGGGGWNMYATGNIRSDMRFWVYINNQPNGNCW